MNSKDVAWPRFPVAGVGRLGLLVWGLLGMLLAGTRAEVLVEIGRNFTGSTYGVDSPYVPPDCNGFAGPQHLVELINGRYSVYLKTTGARVQTLDGESFWRSTGISLAPGMIVSDPRVIFDPASQRWFAAAIDYEPGNASQNRFLVAVSTGTDPTAGWAGVAFTADPVQGDFADFPTLGLDANGVYLGAFLFSGSSGNFLGNTLVSIPKQGLLSATPSIAGRKSFGLLDADVYGYVLQPAIDFTPSNGPARVVAVGDLGLDFAPHSNLVSVSIQNATGPGATLSGTNVVNVPAYEVPINPPQPDGTDNLDDGDARFSAYLYRVGGRLYGVHGIQFNGRAAVRWYVLNATTLAVLHAGTIADPSLHFFYPSIAANPSGTVVVAFSGCSSNSFLSVYAAVGETTSQGVSFAPPRVLKAGAFSYQRPGQNGISRWGDYTTTCVDPADPNRFWTFQMYPSGPDAWATRITELLTARPELFIRGAGTNVVVSWPGTAIPFALEATPSLAPVTWSVVSQPVTTTNGIVSMQLPAAVGARFFRLRQL